MQTWEGGIGQYATCYWIFFSSSVLEEEVCRNSSLTEQFNIVFKTWQKPETQDEKWTRVKRTLYVNTGKESNFCEAEQQITLFLCDDKCRNFTIHCTASISAAPQSDDGSLSICDDNEDSIHHDKI